MVGECTVWYIRVSADVVAELDSDRVLVRSKDGCVEGCRDWLRRLEGIAGG